MEEMNRELRTALGRLLASTLCDPALDEVTAAREEAAKILLRNRARCGDWTTASNAGSFLERWRALSIAKSEG